MTSTYFNIVVHSPILACDYNEVVAKANCVPQAQCSMDALKHSAVTAHTAQ